MIPKIVQKVQIDFVFERFERWIMPDFWHAKSDTKDTLRTNVFFSIFLSTDILLFDLNWKKKHQTGIFNVFLRNFLSLNAVRNNLVRAYWQRIFDSFFKMWKIKTKSQVHVSKNKFSCDVFLWGLWFWIILIKLFFSRLEHFYLNFFAYRFNLWESVSQHWLKLFEIYTPKTLSVNVVIHFPRLSTGEH